MIFCFYVVLFLIVGSRTENATKPNCHISKYFATYNYECPPDSEQNVELEIKPSNSIRIICHKIEFFDDKILPDLNFGNSINQVRIENCPIPRNGFSSLTAKFNIQHFETLEFIWKSSNESIQAKHFEGLERLRELVLYRNNLTSIEKKMFKNTPNLSTLVLDENDITKLQDDVFDQLKVIVYLSLIENHISDISKHVFRGLFRLKELDLRNNKIRNIDSGVFEGLTDLETLSLSYNKLYTLEVTILTPLKNLRYLFMNGNHLVNISRELFRTSAKLEVIDIARNTNLILDDNVFSQFTQMTGATLSFNGIKTIPENLFHGSTNLIIIDFQNNNISFLPEYLFREQQQLRILSLNNNEIDVLNRNIFRSLKNLKFLDLSHNLITALHKNLLDNLLKLQELILSFNRLKTIEPELFLRKMNLRILVINNNDLDFTETSLETLGKCSNIKLINLANNTISQFPYMLMKLLVRNVNYEYGVKNVMATHDVPSGEIEVYLRNNMISNVQFDYLMQENVSYRSIVRVEISQNPIFCDCKASDLVAYSHQKLRPENIILKYEALNCEGPPGLENVTLDEVHADLLSCPLSRNCTAMGECDCSYQSVDGTFIVDCSRRNLTEIPELRIAEVVRYYDFIKLKRIVVRLEDNFLQEGPTEQNGYYNVTKLFLQRNNMSSIKWFPSTIEVLNLENNYLDSIDSSVLRILNESSIKKLHLGHNPWKCDCSTNEFHKFLRDHISQIYNATSIFCTSIDLPLINMDESLLCPVKRGHILVASSIILLFLITILAAALLYLMYQKEIFIWLYSRDTCMWLIEEEQIDRSKKYDAFVSYAHQDEDFVMEELVPVLENGQPPYKLCVHIRDWIPGEYITKQIANSVKESRRTLIVLSTDFLKSMWGRMEFRTAHTAAVEEGRVRVIIIMYGIIDISAVNDDLKSYMKMNTYIQWGDPCFWEKLRYALPRTNSRHKKTNRKGRGDSEGNGIELH